MDNQRMAERPMRAPACMITSAFLAQLATCVGYLRCRLFIPRPCRTRIAAYIFSRVEMQNLRARRFHGLCNNKLRLPTKGSQVGGGAACRGPARTCGASSTCGQNVSEPAEQRRHRGDLSCGRRSYSCSLAHANGAPRLPLHLGGPFGWPRIHDVGG